MSSEAFKQLTTIGMLVSGFEVPPLSNIGEQVGRENRKTFPNVLLRSESVLSKVRNSAE